MDYLIGFIVTVLIFIFCLVFFFKSLKLTNAWEKHISEWKAPVSKAEYWGSAGAGWLGWMGMFFFGTNGLFSFLLIIDIILLYVSGKI